MEFIASPQHIRHVAPRPPLGSGSDSSAQDVSTKVKSSKKIPPGFTCAPSVQTNPLSTVLLILLATNYIKIDRTSPSFIDQDRDDYLLTDKDIGNYNSEPDVILDILASIHPHMEPRLQEGINFIFGLSEARDKLKSIIDGSYQNPRIHISSDPPTSYQERTIGIIKSIQPYISLENQTIINRVLDINDTARELLDRLERLRQKDYISTQGVLGINLGRLMEILDIIKILIPAEAQQYISQINNIVKVMEAVELAQLLHPSDKAGLASETEAEALANNNDGSNTTYKESDDREKLESHNNIGDLSNGIKTMLNPEQAKSLELVMNMIQLLGKKSDEKNNAD